MRLPSAGLVQQLSGRNVQLQGSGLPGEGGAAGEGVDGSGSHAPRWWVPVWPVRPPGRLSAVLRRRTWRFGAGHGGAGDVQMQHSGQKATAQARSGDAEEGWEAHK